MATRNPEHSKASGSLLPSAGVDPSLADLVNWVDGEEAAWNADHMGVPIVLTVGGTLIRGTLIPVGGYLKLTDEMIGHELEHDQSLVEADPRYLAMHFIRLIAELDRFPDHLHLEDAQHMTPSGWWPETGLLWRGRIDAVSGWTMGADEPDAED